MINCFDRFVFSGDIRVFSKFCRAKALGFFKSSGTLVIMENIDVIMSYPSTKWNTL